MRWVEWEKMNSRERFGLGIRELKGVGAFWRVGQTNRSQGLRLQRKRLILLRLS
jgi:hypothetical protein